jgi:hypothetical protein
MADLVYSSNVNDCRWHEQQTPQAFERWHFDALSDDGREAVVVTFHDNYALSPRYFRHGKDKNGSVPNAVSRCPAVSFSYWADGKAVLRTVNEFEAYEFAAMNEPSGCSIGASSFHMGTASYGSGFVLHVDLITTRKRRITAEFEWLSVESDQTGRLGEKGERGCWNMAVPRSDVSGKITLKDRRGRSQQLAHFRGTGSCDNFRSSKPTEGFHYWGRAHFSDATVIFHFDLDRADDARARLFLVSDGNISQRNAKGLQEKVKRSSYGAKVPQRLSLVSDDNVRLCVEPVGIIQKGLFETRVLGEFTLTLDDEKPKKAVGMAELVTPDLMKSRLLRWMADRRIGRNGKGPLY